MDVEHEVAVISQYPLTGFEIRGDELLLRRGNAAHRVSRPVVLPAPEAPQSISFASSPRASHDPGFHAPAFVLVLCTGNSCRSHLARRNSACRVAGSLPRGQRRQSSRRIRAPDGRPRAGGDRHRHP